MFTDVLIVGSGVAGLRAALACDPSLQTLVITKSEVLSSNTHQAQGGVAVVLGADDSVDDHIRDTLEVGRGLCDSEVVRLVCSGGEEEFRQLIAWGARFDRQGEDWSLGLEGGHSHRRIVHADGAQTGREITRVLLDETRRRDNIDLKEHHALVDLVHDEDGVAGALVWEQGRPLVIRAGQVVLASGGCGHLYRETSNPPVATGDGLAVAMRSGVRVRDLEFMQFHPTTLYIAGASRMLISEAVRGAGGRLIDRHGHPIMEDRHPRGDLAPRDVVSRAILEAIRDSGDTRAYLDVRHFDDFASRFPGLDRTCRDFGVDPSITPIPVHPSAHYHIGGIDVDLDGRTSRPHLWAAGEAARSGLHGANRLASNSLLEGLVLGARVGRALTSQWREPPVGALSIPDTGTRPFDLDTDDLRRSLRHLMWREAGILRSGSGLEEAQQQIAAWRTLVGQRRPGTLAQLELRNLLEVALGLVQAARHRTASCGTHYRIDEVSPAV